MVDQVIALLLPSSTQQAHALFVHGPSELLHDDDIFVCTC